MARGFTWVVTLVVTGSSNAVNMTDGLDGLRRAHRHRGGGLRVFAYVLGRVIRPSTCSSNLPGSGELTVSARRSWGALGFLWFNAHPARYSWVYRGAGYRGGWAP